MYRGYHRVPPKPHGTNSASLHLQRPDHTLPPARPTPAVQPTNHRGGDRERGERERSLEQRQTDVRRAPSSPPLSLSYPSSPARRSRTRPRRRCPLQTYPPSKGLRRGTVPSWSARPPSRRLPCAGRREAACFSEQEGDSGGTDALSYEYCSDCPKLFGR